MALVTGFGRGYWGEEAFGSPIPVIVGGVDAAVGQVGQAKPAEGVVANPTGVVGTAALGSVTIITEHPTDGS
jgi:sugar (pentulose or hexulose) kinase